MLLTLEGFFMISATATEVLPRGVMSLANATVTTFHHPLLKPNSVLALMPRNAGAGRAIAIGLHVGSISIGGCTITHPSASAVRTLSYYIL